MIHLVTVFSRHYLTDLLIKYYEPMGVVWHPITYKKEKPFSVDLGWIEPHIVNEPYPKVSGVPARPAPRFMQVKTKITVYALNHFIKNADIVDEDYYVIVGDDDMYEPGVFDKIKDLDDDIVIISMKRGTRDRTLYAEPGYIGVGTIGQEQIFIKGKIFKTLEFDESDHCADGKMAEYLRDNYKLRYEPELFALWNFFDSERWIQNHD